MDQTIEHNEKRFSDNTADSEDAADQAGFSSDADVTAAEADLHCEVERLSRAAGIDPSSLTDEQIMEALYQIR